MVWIWIGAGFLVTGILIYNMNRKVYDFADVPMMGSVHFPEMLPVGAYPLAPYVTPDQFYFPTTVVRAR